MKFSTMMTVFAVALCMAGCRYNKSATGEIAGDEYSDGQDISAESGIDVTDEASAESQFTEAQSGSFADAGENKFENLYPRCTDVNFAPVYFGFDSTVVPQGELAKIDEVIRHLSDHADRVVVVEGNCDDRGSNEYNMSLGENRAIIVRNYLVQGGIAAERIQTRSYGEEKPAVQGSGDSVWALNRRGEFAIFQRTK